MKQKNTPLLFRLLAGLALLSLPLVGRAQMQPPIPLAPQPGQAALRDCIQELAPDSVAIYYDDKYALSPMACATLRRLTRLDEQGKFTGEARDYRRANNRLLFCQHYDHGVRQGTYEAYHANGQLQTRGAYANGEPSGEWQFWYANGQPRQVLRRNAQPNLPWRFIAYWDSTGQQLLTEGNGHWQQPKPGQALRIEGQVVNELPDGNWQLYYVDKNSPGKDKLLTTDTYERGAFKKGHEWVGISAANYRDKPRLLPLLDDRSAEAARYRLGMSCAELARQQASSDAVAKRISQTQAANAHVKSLLGPRPDGNASNYLRELLQQLSAASGMTALLHNPQYTAEVEAVVDELGKLHSFRSASPDIQRVFTQLVPHMGRWNAATVNGQPTTSRLTFLLSVVDQQWQVRYLVSQIDVSKAVTSP